MHKLITPYAESFGRPNVLIHHFPDTESYVRIPQIKTLKGKKVLIYHRLYPEPDKRTFELLLILSCLRKQTSNIELFVPYLPYTRQDRENKVGEAVSADVLCGLLKNSGVKKLITYDCHFLPKPGIFKRNGLQIKNKSAKQELLKYAKKHFKGEKFIVISPDEGASYFALGGRGHSLRKVRKASKVTGRHTEINADIDEMMGEVDVRGQNVCILDDIIATGGTIIRAIEHMRSHGAKKIIVGTVHGVFTDDHTTKKIIVSCDGLFTTNSILKDEPKNSIKIVKLPEVSN